MIFEQAACSWKNTVDIGTQCTIMCFWLNLQKSRMQTVKSCIKWAKNCCSISGNILFSVNISTCAFIQIPILHNVDVPESSLGWMYPYDSMLQPLFDRYMLEIFQSGISRRIFDPYNPESQECKEEGINPVNLNFVAIVFFILILGIVFSAFLLLLELCGLNLNKYINQ